MDAGFRRRIVWRCSSGTSLLNGPVPGRTVNGLSLVVPLTGNSARSSTACLSQKLPNGTRLIPFLSQYFQIKVSIVFDWVTVGIEQRGVPVAQSHVALRCMERQAEITPGNIQLRLLARHDHHWGFGIGPVVTGTRFGEVNDRRIVKHRTVAFRNGLEFRNHFRNLSPMTGLNDVSEYQIQTDGMS